MCFMRVIMFIISLQIRFSFLVCVYYVVAHSSYVSSSYCCYSSWCVYHPCFFVCAACVLILFVLCVIINVISCVISCLWYFRLPLLSMFVIILMIRLIIMILIIIIRRVMIVIVVLVILSVIIVLIVLMCFSQYYCQCVYYVLLSLL